MKQELSGRCYLKAGWGFPGASDGIESACDAGDVGSIPGSGRCPGEGNGHLLQYFCLENPHGQRSLAATVHGAAKRVEPD